MREVNGVITPLYWVGDLAKNVSMKVPEAVHIYTIWASESPNYALLQSIESMIREIDLCKDHLEKSLREYKEEAGIVDE